MHGATIKILLVYLKSVNKHRDKLDNMSEERNSKKVVWYYFEKFYQYLKWRSLRKPLEISIRMICFYSLMYPFASEAQAESLK